MSLHPPPDLLRSGLQKLEDRILRLNFEGYDPYDGLEGAVFRVPLFRENRIVRLVGQQLLRRIPLNLRPLLGIAPGLNPVTLGLCLKSFALLSAAYEDRRGHYEGLAQTCIQRLQQTISDGYHGTCWGYNFDWEGMYTSVKRFQPTIVATGIITDGLFHWYRLTGDEVSRQLCEGAANFVIHDLRRHVEGDAVCFSYSPFDSQRVLNATAKGARLLAQVYSMTGEESLRTLAAASIKYVTQRQRPDGGWPYSVNDRRSWVDNYHTGYVLDSLDDYVTLCNDQQYENTLKAGVRFYCSHFIEDGRIPRYYENKTYPVDSTAVGQTLLTLTRFGERLMATDVALWAIENMQAGHGGFYYQKHRFYTNRISYMRWSDGWMYAGLSFLLKSLEYSQ